MTARLPDHVTSSADAIALRAAIHSCCAARGDSDAERSALIAEALSMPTYLHADLREHFAEQARLFSGIAAPSPKATR